MQFTFPVTGQLAPFTAQDTNIQGKRTTSIHVIWQQIIYSTSIFAPVHMDKSVSSMLPNQLIVTFRSSQCCTQGKTDEDI